MYWVYIIYSKSRNELYIGQTGNPTRRLEEHNSGLTPSTARYKPWIFVYLEGYFSHEDAKKREQNLKYYGRVYSQLKRRIENSIQSAKKVRG